MTDIELTEKIKNLKWQIDDGVLKCDLVHYEIIKKKGYVDLKAKWISPDMPAICPELYYIYRKAGEAYKQLVGGE